MKNLEIQCEVCKKELQKWPLYYFGAGPNNPQDTEVYFCGPYCSNDYHYKKKGEEEMQGKLFRQVAQTEADGKAIITFRNDIGLEFQVLVDEKNLVMRNEFMDKKIALRGYGRE